MLFLFFRRVNPIIIIPTISRSSFLLLQPSHSSLTHCYTTSTTKDHSFTYNYLINNCGFPPETASKLSTRVNLRNSERADSVLAIFRNLGFSDTQLRDLIYGCPNLLVLKPNKTILPKFQFLISKGASSSDLVKIVTQNSRFLYRSLENTVIPRYDFAKSFLRSDDSIVSSMKFCGYIITSKNPAVNVQVLLQHGVPKSKVANVLRYWAYTLLTPPAKFKKAGDEVKRLGFNPNSTNFIVALRAKLMGKPLWEKKVGLYKKWGWSEEIVVSAFLKNPSCMLVSEDKIEAVMEFWVSQMGWDSLLLAKNSQLLLLSLEKRVMPRAFVLQFLQSKGLLKDAKSLTPYKLTENMFLQKFVNSYKEKEASQLLKLYEEKRDLSSSQHRSKVGSAPFFWV